MRERSSAPFVEAYVTSVSRRVPLLCVVVLFDVVLLDYSFHSVAPFAVRAIGVVLVLVAGSRGGAWLPRRLARMSIDDRRQVLKDMSTTGGLFSLGFMVWAVSLTYYGSVEQRMLVHYVLAVTAFAAIVALAQAPRTAMNVALAYTIPATAVFLVLYHTAAIQLALVQIAFSATMLIAIGLNHREFVWAELAGQRLARRLDDTARESRDNYQQATIDELTGGLNRRAILQHLREGLVPQIGLDAPVQPQARPWLALADLDGFKHVNDTYGHAAGDAVLRDVAERIGAQAGVMAHGRLGGDEFAMLFDGALDHDGMRAAGRQLSLAISQPIAFNATQLRVFCSIGVYRLALAETSACLERADAALYKAKQQGDGSVVLFGPDDEAAHRQRAQITRQFHDSVLEDRMRLVYQPVIDTLGGQMVAAQALANWSPDGRTWLSPETFTDMAHATGRMAEVTRLVLSRALLECRPADHAIAVSISLSARDVMRDDIAGTLAAITADAGGRPSDLVFEVTERALMDDPRRATRQLEALRGRGFRIALDDFGAGWSSLSQLRDLPLDLIKLHGALAQALPNDPGARALAGMIVALSCQLGLGCTIKGIETEAQAAAARALGITRMQGYLFGAPDSAAVMLARLRRAVA